MRAGLHIMGTGLFLALLCLLAGRPVPIAAYAKDAYAYNSLGKRDPFVPLVGVTAKAVESLEDVMAIEDVELQGLATNSGGRLVAILNGEMVKTGDRIGRLFIQEISRDKVRLMIDEAEHTLNIYEPDKK